MKILNIYNRKHLLYLLSVFVGFLAIIFFSEYRNEQGYRIKSLNKELDGYTEIVDKYIKLHLNNTKGFKVLDSLLYILPDTNLRITIVNLSGKVLFDSQHGDIINMENHLSRPEIQTAQKKDIGTNIRTSNTTGIKYYYFAKRFPNCYIRLSLPYNIEAKQLLEPDKLPLISIVLLFFISSIALLLISNRFSRSVANLKQFTMLAGANIPIEKEMVFPPNELGSIGQEIIDIYQRLDKAKKELSVEKDKLVRHLNLIEEGIAIFTKECKNIVCNSNFIQFTNLISENLVYASESFFIINEFKPITGFIEHYTNVVDNGLSNLPTYEININKNGKFFTVKCIVFEDKTFEIIISDNTKPAKRKVLKQQITDNIAHELKTPVSSIKGFLETMINNKLDITKQSEFINKAYIQTCRLTNLVDDIALLTKIEEAGSLYQLENISLNDIISNVIDDVHVKLEEKHIEVTVNIPSINFYGNQVLLYSIFRNLFDNVINYAGSDVTINIKKYSEDDQNYYFSFADTGIGVPESDLSRLFERFYRVNKGRDRKNGGTGLGLAIVKNAIEFHKGAISVKNRKEGGLEFLFSINRTLGV